MKFSNLTIDQLIEWLQDVKHSGMFDCHYVTRAFGEIHVYNGEHKQTKEEYSHVVSKTLN